MQGESGHLDLQKLHSALFPQVLLSPGPCLRGREYVLLWSVCLMGDVPLDFSGEGAEARSSPVECVCDILSR